ncbi:hypothetical protein VULLAG_LOCUS17225 [Vulpes lagopus]
MFAEARRPGPRPGAALQRPRWNLRRGRGRPGGEASGRWTLGASALESVRAWADAAECVCVGSTPVRVQECDCAGSAKCGRRGAAVRPLLGCASAWPQE